MLRFKSKVKLEVHRELIERENKRLPQIFHRWSNEFVQIIYSEDIPLWESIGGRHSLKISAMAMKQFAINFHQLSGPNDEHLLKPDQIYWWFYWFEKREICYKIFMSFMWATFQTFFFIILYCAWELEYLSKVDHSWSLCYCVSTSCWIWVYFWVAFLKDENSTFISHHKKVKQQTFVQLNLTCRVDNGQRLTSRAKNL